MEKAIKDLETLFDEAKQKREFDFVLTLINYRGMGTRKLTTNLHEWFEAIEFYKKLYQQHSGKEKTRIGTLLYSTFFENSDFYNIIGSLCKIKLGYKGSSFLFWKTKKYERLLGIGEKQEFLLELLDDAEKPNIITFFVENHIKQIRNTFFHSAYSLSDEGEYILHDSEPINIGGVGQTSFKIESYFYPKIENVITFFDVFKKLYLGSFDSYQTDKEMEAMFPDPCKAIILGSKEGLKGFKVKNSVQFYDGMHDSGIWYEEKYDMWSGVNITIDFPRIETIEIDEALTRYENKPDINRNDAEFQNIVDKIIERGIAAEIYRATMLLIKFGNIRVQKMAAEQNFYKQKSFPRIILPFYRQAIVLGDKIIDLTIVKANIASLEKFLAENNMSKDF